MLRKIVCVCLGVFVFLSMIVSTKVLLDALDYGEVSRPNSFVIRIPPSPSHRVISEEEITWLALNIYFETRHEKKGWGPVAETVLNRKGDPRFPNTIFGVVTQGGESLYKCQYSWRCDGKSDRPRNLRVWKQVKRFSKEFLEGKHQRIVGDAVFYYNHGLAPSTCWGKASSFIKTIGSHRFFGPIPWPEMKALCLS